VTPSAPRRRAQPVQARAPVALDEIRLEGMRTRDEARDPDPATRRRPDDGPARPDVAASALALQRSAGNRAVSALVARTPAPDATEGEGSGEPRATLPGVGTIRLLSVSLPPARPGGTGRPGGRGEQEPAIRELTVTSRAGAHSPALAKAANDGRAMTVEIVLPGEKVVRLTLTGAIISAYQTSGGGRSGDIETWTLDFQGIERSVEGGEDSGLTEETSAAAPLPGGGV
jgi:hypothetical protein